MRVLFLTHRLPYAPNRGDRVRAYELLRRMQDFAEVDLISLAHDRDEASHAADLQPMTSTVRVVMVPRLRNVVRTFAGALTSRPATHMMLDAPDLTAAVQQTVRDHAPSVVFAYCSGVAHAAMCEALKPAPLVVDLVDVDSAKWAALAARHSWPRSWIYTREARLLAQFERQLVMRARTSLVSTEAERIALLDVAPDARVEVVENGVDYAYFHPVRPPEDSANVVFCGVMNYAPNVEAARSLAHRIWPLVRRSRPDARLQLVGSNPTREVRRLASIEHHVDVTGYVPDVRPYLWNGALAVAPLQVARGVQNKVLEAVAAGLPVVVSPVVLNGVPSEAQSACLSAADAPSFAAAILRLLEETPALRRARATAVDVKAMAWERRLGRLGEIMKGAAQPGCSTPGTTKTAAR